MLRANYARELAAWSVLPLMLGVVEGGVVAVLAKTYYAGTVTPATLNMTVAILAGAPAFANIVSFLWAAASHGREKIRMLTARIANLVERSPDSVGITLRILGAPKGLATTGKDDWSSFRNQSVTPVLGACAEEIAGIDHGRCEVA